MPNAISYDHMAHHVAIVRLVFLDQRVVQLADASVVRVPGQASKVACETDVDIFLRQVILVNQYLADLVSRIEVCASFGIVVLLQELTVAILNDGF